MKRTPGIKKDIILIASLLIAGGIIAAILFLGGKSGSFALVRVDGNVVKELPLNVDCEFEIEGADGGRNVLIIEGGSARMTEADCPDGLCINMGKINKSGQSIVCLPHKVVVEITDRTSEPDVDVYVE